jgi:hypothetical protein
VVGRGRADAGNLELPGAARLLLRMTLDGSEQQGLVLVHPADDETEAAVTAQRFFNFDTCAPLLGSSLGGSPACNRVLVREPVSVALPPGRYTVYGTMGPFVSIARHSVELGESEQAEIALELTSMPLQPAGTLSADFHVHGAPSFDSSIPDLDRVRAFLASRLQVIAATDHDVVHDYADAIAELGAESRIRLMTGLETTGHVLFDYVPGSDVPQVIGHWNFWPLPRDAEAPWRGAPWDELAEPGLLFTRVEEAGWSADTGVVQLNHPWETAEFGRDRGWAYALGLDTRADLPAHFDGSAQSLFRRKPEGAHHHNSDYHVQEVMNGTDAGRFQQYRAFWFYLLDQGLLRPGTANSDSHGLADGVLGMPRTLVYSDTSFADFDPELFNRAVREGRMLGTNGPIVEVSTLDDQGRRRTPSIEAFAPAADAVLNVRVSAAPWVPVAEVRVIVNGRAVMTLRDELSHPADPFGLDGVLRYEGEIALAELLDGVRHDGWLVVEAGAALMPAADLDCDGIVDTGDNNGDGVIDGDDVDVEPDADTPAGDAEIGSSGCLDDVGPMRDPPRERDREAPLYHFGAVVPGGEPAAFTNPLLFDLDGGGFTGVSR